MQPAAILHAAILASLASCAAPSSTAVDSTPSAPTAHELRMEVDADALFRAQRWNEAADAYRDVVTAHPDDAQAWHHLGYCLHSLGRLDEAIVAHERAATFPSTKRQSLYNVACAYSLKNELDPAFEALDRALAAGFRDARLLQNDTDLANLRADPRFAQRLATLGVRTLDAAFDFWLGEWDVFDPQGQRVGRNSITSAESGFVVLENWTSAGGGTGRSMNFVDPADGAWKQVWVDDHGAVTRYSGSFTGGAMHFEGTRTAGRRATSATRATFTPNPDGSVHQVIEDQSPQGVWAITFDGTYRPRTR